MKRLGLFAVLAVLAVAGGVVYALATRQQPASTTRALHTTAPTVVSNSACHLVTPEGRTIQLPSPGPGQRPATRFARIAYTVNGITSEGTFPVALLNSSLVYCEQNRP